jgi:peptidyl-prolyl cis-trans isomerase C
MRRHLTATALAGLSVVGLGLAGWAVAQDQPAAPAAEAAPPAAVDAGTVLATVNGRDITLGHAIVMRDRLPEQYQALPDDVLMQGIVDQLVDQTLLADLASTSPDRDPLEVQLHLENERRGTLAARVVQERIGAALDEAEVQAAYDARVAAFEPAKEFSAAHILVATEAEAADLRARIDAGEDFAELARAHSTDPGSAQNGGALGWFGAGQMVPEFETAVAAMEPGAVSAPVQTQFGWHVVKLDETRDTTPPPLAQLRPEIENALRQAKLEAELSALREAATIERPEAAAPPAAIRQSDLVKG